MTIYKPKLSEKKDDSNVPLPEVVTETLLEKRKQPQVAVSAPPPPAAYLAAIAARRRRSKIVTVCNVLIALSIVAIGVIGGIAVYSHLAKKTFRGFCGVRYFERQEFPAKDGHYERHNDRQVLRGEFEEKIEIDLQNMQYERLEVPEIEECKKATILHDFEKNLTAVVDRDHAHCFILPLNRSLVRPPQDFWDLLQKLKVGYYLPDMEVVRDRYRVVTPPLRDLSPLGFHIWRECRYYDTFNLARMGQPVAMTKRAAGDDWCNFKFSLGASAGPVLEFVELDGCL
ncbi:hypothetical protein CAPTEDRAFT_229186 [Capitella teleta]|uniref:Integral membrane protein 2 n=1 Tax=Capitella teleta TaxID=283909 RepID=R7TYW8_CAPTE|nr:hypothetical protein CAPTEDRAFT_229186 [Capitella teleta]|eukprot:ELT98934.1 hypothetical protein CAPTEDRAFT_229186 [Capitella teleta]